MKKIFLMITMLAVTVLTFGQTAADSTFAGSISNLFGINSNATIWIATLIGTFLGQIIPTKWAAPLFYAEKISQGITYFLHWLNEKTNKGQKK